MTPEELQIIQVEEFNNGNIDFLITLYACFASKPGQVVKGLENIRQYFLPPIFSQNL